MATSKGFAQFAKRISFRAKEVADNAEKAVRRAAIAADEVLVLSTPVDTGRARANWIPSVGKPILAELQSTDKSGNETMAKAHAVVAGWTRLLGPIYYANSLPYIQRLDEGYSAQAPNGMTTGAITAARAQLQAAKLLGP
jgi:hypothetical protein